MQYSDIWGFLSATGLIPKETGFHYQYGQSAQSGSEAHHVSIAGVSFPRYKAAGASSWYALCPLESCRFIIENENERSENNCKTFAKTPV